MERAADALAAAEADLTPAIDKLHSQRALSQATVPQIMVAHAVILKALKASAQELNPAKSAKAARSFASKYLHFHAEIVPIYDSLASNNVARFLSWPNYCQELRQIRQSVVLPHDGDRAYFDYIVQFSLLYDHLCSLRSPDPVSVKGIDQMLRAG